MLEKTLPLLGPYQVTVAATDTDFASIRDDPRFQKMVADAQERHGLTPDAATAI